MHLVAQREALLSLESTDSRYSEYLEAWLAGLSPAERLALRGYDHAVDAYKVSAAVSVEVTQGAKPQLH